MRRLSAEKAIVAACVVLGLAVAGAATDPIPWSRLTGIPAGFADGRDDGITSETDPKVGDLDRGEVPHWDGSKLVGGEITESYGRVRIRAEVEAQAGVKARRVEAEETVKAQRFAGRWSEYQYYVTPDSQTVLNEFKANRVEAGHLRVPRFNASPGACADGEIALTAKYALCACRGGTGWVKTSDGATPCAWN